MPYKKTASGKFVRDTEGVYALHRIETYRIWFEYLRRAENPDTKFYADWKGYKELPFKEWWDLNWIELFSEPPAGDLQLVTPKAKQRDGFIYIEVPVAQDVDKNVKDFRLLLKDARKKATPEYSLAKYQITEDTIIKRASLRYYLRVYDLRNEGHSRDQVANTMWNERKAIIKKYKGTERDGDFDPIDAFNPLVDSSVVDTAENPTAVSDAASNTLDNHRRYVSRYYSNAKKIIENVERGDFPGKYN